MGQRIKRGGTAVRKTARRQSTKARVGKARAQTSSLMGAVLSVLPFTEEQIQRAMVAAILFVTAAFAWWLATVAGVIELAHHRFAVAAADSGFEVRRVEVRGVERMNELKVYERVLGAKDRAMPLVDLDAMRGGLLELSWVKDARISRQLPDTLVVDIVEREPHAVLRKPGRLVLIDAEGAELEPIAADAAKGMLHISGPGAGKQVERLSRLLDAAPALRPQVTDAEWVGNRRWNVTFNTDQVLALPMGDEEAATAFVSFAQMDGVNRLIGGKVATFDMRSPERIYMRPWESTKGEQE
ncbi:cell division protein FtsQ/DivIB [Altererythrobacter sp. CAU 1778]